MKLVPRIGMTLAAVLLPVLAVAQAPEEGRANSRVLWIGLANGTKGEVAMASELRLLTRKYHIEPWVLTRSVLIDETRISHSHPTLTIHTRHIGKELELLSTFVHEQLHWLEEEPWLADFHAAMQDLKVLFPDVLPALKEAHETLKARIVIFLCAIWSTRQ